MFQYTKENILNDVPAIKISGEKVLIEGLGEYLLSGIVDKTIYVTEGEEGDKSTLSLSEEELINETGGERILTFRVITPNQYLAEYASPNWQVFGKPIVVGYNETTLDGVKKAIELAIPEGNKFITVSVEDDKLTLTGTSNYMTFDKVSVISIDSEGKETVTAIELKEGEGGNYIKNVEPFATKEWIIENLRFPTYPNIRYASASTMPTADVYTEFAFTYAVPRVGLGGLSGVGQGMTAVTRHIFYLPKGDKANAFKEALSELGESLKFDTNESPDADKNYENDIIPDVVPDVVPDEAGE